MKKVIGFISGASMSLIMSVAHGLDINEESLEGAPSGQYDFLVYAVTWQPTFCLIKSCAAQPREEFYTHGIWAYLESVSDKTNRHPSFCAHSKGCDGENNACAIEAQTLEEVKHNADFMNIVTESPEGLMKHEWNKHGTCYGKSQMEYFQDFVRLRQSVQVGAGFSNMIDKGGFGIEQVKAMFPSNASFRCAEKDGKQYLFEVFYRIDRDGRPYEKEGNLQIGMPCNSEAIYIPGVIGSRQ